MDSVRNSLLIQFAAVSFVMLTGIGLVLGFILFSKIRSHAVDDLVDQAVQTASGQLLDSISSTDFEAVMSGDRYNRFDELVQRYVLSDRTVRVTLWSKEGTIIYSDDAGVVGDSYPGKEGLAKALAGETPVEIVPPGGERPSLENTGDSLIEVYTPVTLPGESAPIGVLEIDQEYDPTARLINDLRRWVIVAVVGGFVIVYGFLVLVVWRGWRTIVGQRVQLQSVNTQLSQRVEQIQDSNQRLGVEIVERKRAEATTRSAQAKLESRVKESTDELSKTSKDLRDEVAERGRIEEQFRQAQKMEAIGQLAGGMAHDFNNLLTAIMSYSQLGIIKLARGEEAKECLEGVQTAAERASLLTRQLLAFSRRQVVEPRVVNLNDLVLDVDKMLRRLIGEDIELVILPATDLGEVKIDPGQMEQVVLNMAVNARDAMPHGGKIVIRMSNANIEEESGRHVVLSVSDTGVGIEEDVKQHIFEPFFTTKAAGKGTGLGLSTCYGIIDQRGGHIDVRSEVGRGTTFDIFLPRVDEPVGPLPLSDDPDYLPVGNEAVLLVEDEPLVREVTAAVLKEQGYSVLTAANGHEALSIANHYKDREIHLLLADVVMPLMGGQELSEQLKKLHPETKVLYTSGYADDMMANYGFSGQASEFVQKPFTPAALAQKVREVLEK